MSRIIDKGLWLALILFMISLRGVISQNNVRYWGYVYSTIESDPYYHSPNRELDYPFDYRTFKSSPSVWTNYLNMWLSLGGPREKIYFVSPITIRFGAINNPQNNTREYRMYNYVPSITLAVGDEKLKASVMSNLSGNRAGMFRNANYGYSPLGALGNFKYANANDGTFIAKIDFSPTAKAKGTLVALQSNAVTFIPIVESLPQLVSALEIGPQKIPLSNYKFTDEGEFSRSTNRLPTYYIAGLEGSQLLQKDDKWGIYYGNKYVYNPGFRINEGATRSEQFLNSTLGYKKNALELNWHGSFNKSEFTFAGSISSAQWSAFNSEVSQNLGSVGGKSMLFKIDNYPLGLIKFRAQYCIVEPDYQFVMARHPDYALVGSQSDPNDPDSPFHWGMQEDSKWNYRNFNRSEEYLSYISRFLGMQNFDINLEATKIIKGKPIQVNTKVTSNIWLDPQPRIANSDVELNLRTKQDFQQVLMGMRMDYNDRSNLNLKLINRFYERDFKNSLSGIAFTWGNQLTKNIIFQNDFELRNRIANGGLDYGIGSYFKSELVGTLAKGTQFAVSLQGNGGTYDFGLIREGYDQIVDSHYNYLKSEVFFNRKGQLAINGKRITLSLGGIFWNQKSNLAGITNGTSLVGYGEVLIPWLNETLTQQHSIITTQGPVDAQLPTGYITKILDNTLTYRFDKGSYFSLRSTHWPTSELLAEQTITSGELRLNFASGYFILAYGRGNTRWHQGIYNASTLDPKITYDGRKIPPKLIGGYPWSYWWPSISGELAGYKRIQYTNFYSITYRFNF